MQDQRINKLAKKQKEVGLTEKEKEEQAALREEYLRLFKEGFKQRLENMVFVDDEEGEEQYEKMSIMWQRYYI